MVLIGDGKDAAEEPQLRHCERGADRLRLRQQRRGAVDAGGAVRLRGRRRPQLPRRKVGPPGLAGKRCQLLLQGAVCKLQPVPWLKWSPRLVCVARPPLPALRCGPPQTVPYAGPSGPIRTPRVHLGASESGHTGRHELPCW